MMVHVDVPRTFADNLFEDFLADFAPVYSCYHQYPALDMAEYENESVVVAELPGVKKEDLKITIENGVLTIRGIRKPYEVPQDARILLNEMPVREFSRSIELPHEVNLDKISAELENGLLRITLPKTEEARVRTIQVQ